MLRRLNIRPRPFYNTRHSYASFLVSVGAKLAFVSAQTGDSIKTLEAHYAKYLPQADSGRDLIEQIIAQTETQPKPSTPHAAGPRPFVDPEIKKALVSQGLEDGAGEEGRTPDLMLGKHTL